MRLKVLLKARYTVAAIMEGTECPALDFLTQGEDRCLSSREALADILERVANDGLEALSSKMTHEADKRLKVYEFIKGDLRLFYFKGKDGVIVICTVGVVKKGQKADPKAVHKTAEHRSAYLRAMEAGAVQLEEDKS